ncbi:hypothetical protein [Actinophytocola algeriensis]|uniref:Uncharacterized protein (DUF3084 family) n=1 Tax=Actinophytocola algeriensis TaxID=1768010 RepID=A0A7W7VEH2_9PSEU|nr:hypothetical protein [Actinophytocola algeriensis]MBB4907258.1 uncharacterized protein (DUF3084 family) [Actinophytocola algeriensis]MBE1478741.1 uncharacterized protein (DUF3084 family) [Actinophytocola algeriensis]
MRKIALGMRWGCRPAVTFFLFALVTGVAVEAGTVALVFVGVAVIVVSVVDLAVRHR